MRNQVEWVGVGLGVTVGLAAALIYTRGVPESPFGHSAQKPTLTEHLVAAQPQNTHTKPDLRRRDSAPLAYEEAHPTSDRTSKSDLAEVAEGVLDPAPAYNPPALGSNAPLVSIVIDDMGGNVRLSQQALTLPADITFAFLPYPDATPKLAGAARAMGREVILHMPMQPRGEEDPGPGALRPDAEPAKNMANFNWALTRVATGSFNNHMGSRMTMDAAALRPIMQEAAARGVRFLDSRTAGRSVALRVARAEGVEALGRDVFLDHVIDPKIIRARLNEAEAIARKRGYAIAIGHPHPATIAVLADWMVEARARGVNVGNLNAAFVRAGQGAPEIVKAEDQPVRVAAAPLMGGAVDGSSTLPPTVASTGGEAGLNTQTVSAVN